MANPAASPAVSSTVGLKNMVIAPLTVDTEETHDLRRRCSWSPARSRRPSRPENSDPDVQYFDDQRGRRSVSRPGTVLQNQAGRSAADHPGDDFRQQDRRQRRADPLGPPTSPPISPWASSREKANGKYRYVWLYKVRAKPVTESYATKEGKSITRQTGEVEWTAIQAAPMTVSYQAVADEGENGFTAEKARDVPGNACTSRYSRPAP